MNKFLSDGLSFLNSILATVLIVFGAAFGYMAGDIFGLILGFIAGFFVATLICGVLAVFLHIRDELVLANNLSLELLNELKKEQK